MAPLSRAETSKSGSLTRGQYYCDDMALFIDPDVWPTPETGALRKLAATYAMPERKTRRRKGPDGADLPEDRLADALMGILRIQLFPMYSPKQFGVGNRMEYFLGCGHAIGTNVAVDGSDIDLASLMFEEVADQGFVDWVDDSSGVKRQEALVHFANGIGLGRLYSAPAKEHMLERRINALNLSGKNVGASSDELTATFRNVFGGAAHLRVQKSGTENIGYEFFLKRGAGGLHLDPHEIHDPEVEVVQLPKNGTPKDRFQEIIRQLGLAGRTAQDFIGAKAGYPNKVWDLFYQQGSALQTQIDWTIELRSNAEAAKSSDHFAAYGDVCESLEASEASRLWLAAAPRKKTKAGALGNFDRDKPYISGLRLNSRDELYFIASQEWWDRFLSDNASVDGITKWMSQNTSSLERRGFKVRVVSLDLLIPSEEIQA